MNLLPCYSSNSCSIYFSPFLPMCCSVSRATEGAKTGYCHPHPCYLPLAVNLTDLMGMRVECGACGQSGSTMNSLIKGSTRNASKPAARCPSSQLSVSDHFCGKNCRVTRSMQLLLCSTTTTATLKAPLCTSHNDKKRMEAA